MPLIHFLAVVGVFPLNGNLVGFDLIVNLPKGITGVIGDLNLLDLGFDLLRGYVFSEFSFFEGDFVSFSKVQTIVATPGIFSIIFSLGIALRSPVFTEIRSSIRLTYSFVFRAAISLIAILILRILLS